jgi:LAO/AO transport system kinase
LKPRTEALIERMLAGDRIALAKLMTLVESRDVEATEVMSRLHGRYDRAYVVGITGPPGAGKSTLLDRLVGELRSAGREVGIVAVDPSSPFSGGAVLGDRIRMQNHFLDQGVFIRSLSARGSMGGLARGARDVTRLLDAFGKDLVIVETVGVGQNEFDVMRLAQTVVVVLVPEAGDTVQTMKAGLLEIADIFVVNKADREGADRIEAELFNMLHLRPASGWDVPVLLTVATEGRGVPELVTTIDKHRRHLESSGEGAARAAAGRRAEFLALLRDEIGRRVEQGLVEAADGGVLGRIERGEADPYATALEILSDPSRLRAIVRDGRGGRQGKRDE